MSSTNRAFCNSDAVVRCGDFNYLRYIYLICSLYIAFVFGRKRCINCVFVSFRSENKLLFSVLVSFSAENAKPGFDRSLVLLLTV